MICDLKNNFHQCLHIYSTSSITSQISDCYEDGCQVQKSSAILIMKKQWCCASHYNSLIYTSTYVLDYIIFNVTPVYKFAD